MSTRSDCCRVTLAFNFTCEISACSPYWSLARSFPFHNLFQVPLQHGRRCRNSQFFWLGIIISAGTLQLSLINEDEEEEEEKEKRGDVCPVVVKSFCNGEQQRCEESKEDEVKFGAGAVALLEETGEVEFKE